MNQSEYNPPMSLPKNNINFKFYSWGNNRSDYVPNKIMLLLASFIYVIDDNKLNS